MMKIKNIVIVTPFSGEINGELKNRFLYLASCLADIHHNVTLITSNFLHQDKSFFSGPKTLSGFNIDYVKVTKYNSNVSISRIISHLVFSFRVFWRVLSNRRRIDVLYISYPLALPFFVTWFIPKSVKVVCDVQDLWPESFTMIIRSKIYKCLFWPIFSIWRMCVKLLLMRVDLLVAVSDSFIEHAKKFYFFNPSIPSHCCFIGADYPASSFPVRDVNKPFSIEKNQILRLIYVGSLEGSYDLHTVIRAVGHYSKRKEKSIELIFVGDGSKKDSLLKLSRQMNVKLSITGWVEKEALFNYLSSSHIAINPIVGDSVASIINKHADYTLSALPILNSQSSVEWRTLLDEFKAGINYPAKDFISLSNLIRSVSNDNELYWSLSQGSYNLGVEKFDRSAAYDKLAECILSE